MTHSLPCTSLSHQLSTLLKLCSKLKQKFILTNWKIDSQKSILIKKLFRLASISKLLLLFVFQTLHFCILLLLKKKLPSLSLCARPEIWVVNEISTVLLLKSLPSGCLSIVPWIWPTYRNLSVCTEYARTCHPSGPVWILITHQGPIQVFPPMPGVVSLL